MCSDNEIGLPIGKLKTQYLTVIAMMTGDIKEQMRKTPTTREGYNWNIENTWKSTTNSFRTSRQGMTLYGHR